MAIQPLTDRRPIDDRRCVDHAPPPALRLRPLAREDLAVLTVVASDARLAATCNVPHPFPDDGAEHLFANAQEGWESGRFLVFSLLESDVFRGLAMLHDVDAAAGTAGLAFWVDVGHWGRGLATFAARAACDEAFRERGITVMEAVCLADNAASARVLVAAGFEERGGFVNDGAHGSKFLGRAMRRFERTA
jgi:ribosomal-protein-alanine N-acetyltransferase